MLFIDNKDSVFCNCSVACLLQDKLQQSLNQPERSTSAIKPRKKLNFKKAQQWTDVTAFSVARNATKHGRVRMSTARRVPTM